MKKFSLKKIFSSRSFRVGGYSVISSVIILVIACVINITAQSLPSDYTQFDITSNQLFTISEQSENIIKSLDEDISIYWICQSGYEDETVKLLLERYDGMSDKITVYERDPDIYPTFLSAYGIDDVVNNSVIVESNDKFRYIDGDEEMYEYEYTSYYSYSTYFCGESKITSAINYVVSDNLPTVYILSGHGEGEISSYFTDKIARENIETESLSLLTVGSVPEDCKTLIIFAPQTDISDEEYEAIKEYMSKGGNLLLITDPPENGKLENVCALMSDYGVETVDGIVMEGNQNYYIWQTPYYLLPDLASHDITTPLNNSGYCVLLAVAQGLSVSENLPDGVSVTELLTTSSSAYSKLAGYYLTTYDKEDGDIQGPFSLGVAVTAENSDGSESKAVWISSSGILDENADSRVSGGNSDFFINSLGWMCEKTESISIHSKSLDYEYLSLSSAASSVLSIAFVGIIPLLYILTGIIIKVRRVHR